MGTVKRHAGLTAVGLVLGSAVVYWLQPETVGGTTFVVVVCAVLVNAIGAIRLPSFGRSTSGEGASNDATPDADEDTERS